MYSKAIFENLEKIKNKVEKVTGVDVSTQKTRHADYINAKKIFSVLARKRGYTFQQIAAYLGLTHASVINHTKDFEFLLKYDPQLRENYLRVQGIPNPNSKSRDYFDLLIGNL